VEAILGVPPGDYSTRPFYSVGLQRLVWRPDREWRGDDGKIQVQLDGNGRIAWRIWRENGVRREGFVVEHLRHWIGFEREAKPMLSIPPQSSGSY
jgi:hypothetical protein